jgi:YbgC/YbaW family acyl-CoA thioester hydrolase
MIFIFKNKIYGFDCDTYGHLNNSNYLKIYEAARAEALNEMNMPIAKLKSMNIMLYLVRVEIDFKRGIELEEIVTVKSSIIEHTKLKSIWKQEIYNSQNVLCSSALVTGVYVSSGKPVRISSDLYDFFDKYIEIKPPQN